MDDWASLFALEAKVFLVGCAALVHFFLFFRPFFH